MTITLMVGPFSDNYLYLWVPVIYALIVLTCLAAITLFLTVAEEKIREAIGTE